VPPNTCHLLAQANARPVAATTFDNPADHPVLTFPRAYFAAKDRAHQSGNFPEKTSGRALDRY
jgi:hypothetical protein